VTLANVTAVILPHAANMRAEIRVRGTVEQALELARRLEAFRRLLEDYRARDQIAAEERRTEILVGHLLGPAPGRGHDEEPSTRLLHSQTRLDFRLLAAHEEWVEEWLAEGIVDRPTLLLNIKRRLARRAASGGDGNSAVEAETARYRLLEGDCFGFDAALSREPADFIITDPPYKADAHGIGLCERLAQHAPRWLRPDGCVLLMIGQMYLPEIVRLMAPHLHYRWTLAYLTPGGGAVKIWPHHVFSFWKPVIWFTNGAGPYREGWRGDATNGEVEWVADLAKSDGSETKRHHEWGQSETGMADLMRRFVKPGALVLDPFMGAGTTGVVALRMGCRFVGVDLQRENVRIAAERLAQECEGGVAAGEGGADRVEGPGAQ